MTALSLAPARSGQPAVATAASPSRTGGPAWPYFVATYHYIRQHNSDGVTGITPAEFESQVRAIARRYRVVTAAEFVAFRETEPRLALITFDDAVRDQLVAAEILDRLGLPGVFYAPMRPFGEAEPAAAWCAQHLLHALAERLGWSGLERRLADPLRSASVDEAAMNQLYHYEAPHKRRLKYALAFGLPAAEASAALRAANARVGLCAADWYLTADHLRQIQAAGHALGGHGYDHVPYNTLTPKEQAADMQRAATTMNSIAGALPRTLAYPFGRCTRETEAIARACGYTFAFTTENRVDAKDVRARLGNGE